MKRTPSARAILFCAALGELTLEQANQLLQDAGLGHMVAPLSTWEMIRRTYVPKFRKTPKSLGEMIYHPRSMGGINKE